MTCQTRQIIAEYSYESTVMCCSVVRTLSVNLRKPHSSAEHYLSVGCTEPYTDEQAQYI